MKRRKLEAKAVQDDDELPFKLKGTTPKALRNPSVKAAAAGARRPLIPAPKPTHDSEDDDEEEGSSEGSSGADSDGMEADRFGSDDDMMGHGRERSLNDQVADVPFEVLEALRQDGTGPSGRAARDAAKAALEQQKNFHRANRHRPSEVSSKKPVSRFRDVIQVTKKEAQDPRFEDVNARSTGRRDFGHGSSLADKSYSFVYDEVIPQERKELRARMQKEKNPKFKARIQTQLAKLDQVVRSEDARRKRAKVADTVKATEKQAVAAGKKPYYLKKSEQRRLELLSKYEELKTKGGLEKFMEKRRKRNASKDHRYVPSQRRPADE